MARFVALYDSVIQFFESNNETNLCQQLKTVKNDAFYLADIFKRFHDVNLQLQGANKTLIGCQSIVSLFIDKLELLRYNLLKREFHQFPELSSIKDDVTPEDIDRFSSHLNELKLDMEKRFEDILKLKVYDWMKNPFTANIEEADTTCQEELLEIRYDEESKHKFDSGGYENLWQSKKMPVLYPNMWKMIFSLLIPFPTSYLVESGFSAVNHIMTKERNRLNISERGDLRLFLTKIEPDIQYLVSQHQPQGSH